MLDRRRAVRRLILVLPLACLTVACPKDDPAATQGDATPQTEDPGAKPEAAASAPATPVDLAGWNVLSGGSGVFELAWRSATGAMPRNQDFQLDLLLLKAGAPLPGARISVSGWMPDHGHGMVRAPIVTEQGDGHYQVEGMLLHMRGRWDVSFEIAAEDLTDTLSYTVEL